jgi:hypothetical protein
LETLKKQFPASKSIAEIVVLLSIKDQSSGAVIEQLQVGAACRNNPWTLVLTERMCCVGR